MSGEAQGFDALIRAFETLSGGSAWSAVLAISAAGAISSVVLQAYKELRGSRRAFQQKHMTRWITALVDPKEVPVTSKAPSALNCLIEIVAAGDHAAFFELEPSEITRRGEAAIPVALDAPDRHRNFIVALSQGVDSDVVDLALAAPTQDPAAARAQVEARDRVARRIRARFDALEITMQRRWARIMQTSAIVLTSVVMALAVLTINPGVLNVVVAAIAGAVGGTFAPVTRDLVAVLQRFRKA